MNDLRFAWRQLVKAPGFTAVAVLTVALGIGACTAIYSVVGGVLLRPLPFSDPDRIVTIHETFLPTLPESSVADGQFLLWNSEATSFESLGALGGASYNLTGQGPPLHLYAARVTASLLSTLRTNPALGRNFTPEEDAPYGTENVAMLSYGLWQRQFGGRADVLGKTIQLNGRPFSVVGVMPKDSGLPERVEILAPMGFLDRHHRNFLYRGMQVFGRLKAGVTPGQAEAELAAIAARLARTHPETSGWGVKVRPIMDTVVGSVRPVLWSLLAAVGCLLLIACANVANLLLARSTARSKEMAVRAAVGADRYRIIRQVVVESLVLSGLGAVFGVAIAAVGLKVLLALAPETLPRADNIGVDGQALGFALALMLLTGIGFGMAPALHVSRPQLTEALKQRGRGLAAGGPRERLRSALVVGEVAIALCLLASAGLLMRSFVRLQAVNPGFDVADTHAATVFLPYPKYSQPNLQIDFADRAVAEIAKLPGVEAVGVSANVPFTNTHLTAMGATTRGFTIPSRPPATQADTPMANYFNVGPGYLSAMGIPLLRGRVFDSRDSGTGQPVAMISESIAKRFFPDQDPLGQAISIGFHQPSQIVGIVGDIKADSLDGSSTLQTYVPFAQAPDNDIVFVVRANRTRSGLGKSIGAAIARVDATVPIYNARPLADLVGSSIARQRFAMTLFSVFSAVALVLAAIGIYGVMAYSVSQRAGDIALRMALGAGTGNVLGLVMGQGGRLVGLGVAAGLALALLVTRLLERLLFDVSAYDPTTFVGTIAILVAVAGAACFIPALRAAWVSPMGALRSNS